MNFSSPSLPARHIALILTRFIVCTADAVQGKGGGNQNDRPSWMLDSAGGTVFDRSKKRDSKMDDSLAKGSSDLDYSIGNANGNSDMPGGHQRPMDHASRSTSMIIVTPINILFIAIGCVCGFVVLIGVMVVLYFVRSRRAYASQAAREPPAMVMRRCPITAPSPGHSAQSQPFLPPDSPSTFSKYSAYTTGNMSTSKIYSPVPSILMAEPRTIDVGQCLQHLAIDRSRISLGDLLQQGTFGEIRVGCLYYSDEDSGSGEEQAPVVGKTLKKDASPSQIHSFLTEGCTFFGIPLHQNVNQVVGAVSDLEGLPILLYRFSTHGNLKKFLLRCRGVEPGSSHALSTQDLVFMGVQIVTGMMHLHRYRIVHKDLATRNCILDDNLTVRICDTALSRDLFSADYDCLGDNENRPVRWLAVESLLRHEFSTASDVWSYGVTLWELMTLAQQPYADVDPFELSSYLREGYRLQQPYNCPDELYGVIFCCWALSPEARPTFSQLNTALQDFYNALMRFV